MSIKCRKRIKVKKKAKAQVDIMSSFVWTTVKNQKILRKQHKITKYSDLRRFLLII